MVWCGMEVGDDVGCKCGRYFVVGVERWMCYWGLNGGGLLLRSLVMWWLIERVVLVVLVWLWELSVKVSLVSLV